MRVLSEPPPLPRGRGTWSFRTVRPDRDDVALVHRWMNHPDVARFWDRNWTLPAWRCELTSQLAGTYSRPCLVERDGRPVAYLELYWAGEHEIGRHYVARPGDVGVHIAIGEASARGRGIGSSILADGATGLLAELAADTRVVAEPDARNTAAVRSFVRAGFRVVGEITLPHKRAALVAHTADGAAPPELRTVPDGDGTG